jgi:NDP-sugar pyrophosphorylase family protein
MKAAVILAGGLGERLRPFTGAIPKPLLPIGEYALLEIQILNLAKHGFDIVYIATNYKSEYIETFIGSGAKYGIPVQYSREPQPLGTCGPLSLLRDKLVEPFVVMNGDILTNADLGRFYEYGLDQDAWFTLATKEIRTPFNFGSVETSGDDVVRIEEKPDLVLDIVAGIYFMRPKILQMIPDGMYYGMDTLMLDMLRHGRRIRRYRLEEYWLDIGQIDDYRQAEEKYAGYFAVAARDG